MSVFPSICANSIPSRRLCFVRMHLKTRIRLGKDLILTCSFAIYDVLGYDDPNAYAELLKTGEFKEFIDEMKQFLDTSKGDEALDVFQLEITKYHGDW
jgi:hypothetical protein